MRRLFLGVIVLASLAACTDSTPTGTRPTGPNLRIRTDQVDPPPGSLDNEIKSIIMFWPSKEEANFLAKWAALKAQYQQSQTEPKAFQDVLKKLADLTKQIIKNTPKMDNPTTGETKGSAAARLIQYMNLYVFEGPNADPPPYDPDGETAVGLLTPDKPLTLITPSGHAGVHFDAWSVDADRTIIISKNTTQYFVCDGPLTTTLCQYPLFFAISSYPSGALLKVAVAKICHPPEDDPGGPPDAATHDRMMLAHTAPSDPNSYVPGGIVRTTPEGLENIEILPTVSQTFLPSCENVEYTPIYGEGLTWNVFERGVHLASALVSRIGKFLAPRSAYAVDQGVGGQFLDFSPFNNVDPCSGPYPEPYPTCPSD